MITDKIFQSVGSKRQGCIRLQSIPRSAWNAVLRMIHLQAWLGISQLLTNVSDNKAPGTTISPSVSPSG